MNDVMRIITSSSSFELFSKKLIEKLFRIFREKLLGEKKTKSAFQKQINHRGTKSFQFFFVVAQQIWEFYCLTYGDQPHSNTRTYFIDSTLVEWWSEVNLSEGKRVYLTRWWREWNFWPKLNIRLMPFTMSTLKANTTEKVVSTVIS